MYSNSFFSIHIHFTVHPQCITEWIRKHCTCPICRYELQTNNPLYESERVKRMATRKPRFALYELQRMKVSELKKLCVDKLRIPIVGTGYTKQEIIDKILASERIEIISAPPPMPIQNIATLRGMGVGKLKRKMTEAGVFFDSRDVIEKEDMVQIFINSGRIVFEEEEEEEEKEEEQEIIVDEYAHQKQSFDRDEEEVKRPRIDDEGSHYNSQSSNKVEVEDVSASSISSDGHQSLNADAEILLSSSHHDEEQPETTIQESDDRYSRSTPSTAYSHNESADITRRSIGELKQLAQTLSIDLSSCLEKREMIELIVSAMSRNGVGTRYGGGVVS